MDWAIPMIPQNEMTFQTILFDLGFFFISFVDLFLQIFEGVMAGHKFGLASLGRKAYFGVEYGIDMSNILASSILRIIVRLNLPILEF